MCGLTAFIDFKNETSIEVLENMTDALLHRGPDASGYNVFTSHSGNHIGLGHRRLSIIDLSEGGAQPMTREDLHIVYNGEVYNYQEVKDKLISLGLKFRSTSDTEVILNAILTWGVENALKEFNGMFSMVLFDNKNDKVYAIRDRAGVKPMFVYESDGLFLFASELKSFHKHPRFYPEIDKDSIPSYIQYGYVPNERSIFNHVSKLKPGHYIEIDLKSRSKKEVKYWDVYEQYNKPKSKANFVETVEKLETLLQSSCDYRMVADVPVGVFLSGGYDSSIVSALLQRNSNTKIKTFTIGFEDQTYNEATYAKDVANVLQTEHYEYYCTTSEAQEIIPTLPFYYDEPFADSSAIPTTLVSKIASKHVKVVLSADAGDETFGGYNKYTRALEHQNLINKIPSIFQSPQAFFSLSHFPFPKGKYKRVFQNLGSVFKEENSCVNLMKLSSQALHENDLKKLMTYNFKLPFTHFDDSSLLHDSNDEINKMLAVDYKTYLVDDILTKVDRATMSTSIEGREPLLDYRLIEFAAKLPSSFKIKDSEKKYILKKITHNLLPKELMDRPKMGFGIPYFSWLRKDLKYLIDKYLDQSLISSQGFFSPKFIQTKKRDFLNGDYKVNNLIWTILSFQMWFERWVENSNKH